MNRAMCTSISPHWVTPAWLYARLDAEFHFDDDPCPLSENGIDGLLRPWGKSVFLNPPYGRPVSKWLNKALGESQNGSTVVCLLPARTDTRWWHEYCMKAAEISFIKGRLYFQNSNTPSPFPSVIVVFKLGDNYPVLKICKR